MKLFRWWKRLAPAVKSREMPDRPSRRWNGGWWQKSSRRCRCGAADCRQSPFLCIPTTASLWCLLWNNAGVINFFCPLCVSQFAQTCHVQQISLSYLANPAFTLLKIMRSPTLKQAPLKAINLYWSKYRQISETKPYRFVLLTQLGQAKTEDKGCWQHYPFPMKEYPDYFILFSGYLVEFHRW